MSLASRDKIGILRRSQDRIWQPNEKKIPVNLNYPSPG